MAKIFFLVAVFLCLLLYSANNRWNSGKLLSYDQQTFITHSQTNGTDHEVSHTTYCVQIDGGDRIYFAERTVESAWHLFPKVTQNGRVQWLLNGNDGLLLIDDRGKEFVLTITKTRLKTAAQQ